MVRILSQSSLADLTKPPESGHNRLALDGTCTRARAHTCTPRTRHGSRSTKALIEWARTDNHRVLRGIGATALLIPKHSIGCYRFAQHASVVPDRKDGTVAPGKLVTFPGESVCLSKPLKSLKSFGKRRAGLRDGTRGRWRDPGSQEPGQAISERCV